MFPNQPLPTSVTPHEEDGPKKPIRGKAAEFLVAYDVCMRGHICFLAGEGLPYDIIAEVGAKLIRIQVKSAQQARLNHSSITPKYYFDAGSHYSECADLFAFVALDKKRVIYRDTTLVTKTGFHVHPDKITQEHSDLSWSEAMRMLSK